MLNPKVLEILEELERISGRNAKERIIRENKEVPGFIDYLNVALNPYRIFHIRKVVLPKGFSKTRVFTGLFDMAEYLSSQKGLNNQDIANVYYALKDLKPLMKKWITKAILKKSVAKIGSATVNKALGEKVIPVFDLMLMKNNEPDYRGISFPILAQIKVDGFRFVYIPDKGYFGRSGKLIPNVNLLKHINISEDIRFKGEQVVLDGEAYSHERNFNSLSSILNSENKPIPEDVKFVVFSAVPLSEWLAQEGKTTYREQYEFICKYDWEGTCKNVVPIGNTKIVNSLEEIGEFYKDVIDKGFEGVVVKNPDAVYHWKRVTVNSGIMQKIKPEETADAVITGYFEGEGEIAGKLGGFICELEDGTEVRAGSGFSLKERQEYFDGRELKEVLNSDGNHVCWEPIGDDLTKEEIQDHFESNHLGKWIRMKYMCKTPDGTLRHPRFDSFRDAKE
jgi:DNA ligase-1